MCLAGIGCHECGTVDHGVASVQSPLDRVAVGDVAFGVVGDIDVQCRESGVQACMLSHEKSHGVPRVGDRLGGPTAHESGSAGDEDAHGRP